MWYDVSWPLDAEGWESARLNAMVRQLQPDIIINDRSQLPEDFGTPEQHITPEKGGRAWEACMTFNDSWGYTPIDTTYKNAWQVVSMLRTVAAGGGNLLLNIGPTPEGDVPPICRRELLKVGKWMDEYGPAIYEASDPMQQEWMITGAFTRKGNTAYYHCNRWPGKELAIGGLRTKVKAVRVMNGPKVKFIQTDDRLVLRGLPAEAPSPLATIIELECEGEPVQVLGAGHVLIDNDPWRQTA